MFRHAKACITPFGGYPMSDMLMLTLGLVSDFEAKLDELVDFVVDEVWKVNESAEVLPDDFVQADPDELDWQEVYDYIKPLVMNARWDVIKQILKDAEVMQDAQNSDDDEGDQEETDEADSEA
jgi:hypothetical protein